MLKLHVILLLFEYVSLFMDMPLLFNDPNKIVLIYDLILISLLLHILLNVKMETLYSIINIMLNLINKLKQCHRLPSHDRKLKKMLRVL